MAELTDSIENRSLRAIVAALPEAACLFERVELDDAQQIGWRYVANNSAMRRMFRVDDLTGQFLHERFPEHAEHWHDNLSRTLANGSAELLPAYAAPYDGVYDVVLSLVDSGSRPLVLAIIKDVTAEHKRQEQLARSESRYKALFNAIDEGFCIIDVEMNTDDAAIDFKVVEANAAFEQHSGISGAPGQSMRSLVPTLEEEWYRIYGAVARSGEPKRFELQSAALNRWFDVFAFPAGPTASNLVGVLLTDTTERKTSELAVRQSEKRLSSLIAVTSDVVYEMNADWTELRELYGKDLLQPNNDPSNWLTTHLLEADRPAILDAVAQCIEKRTSIDREVRVRKADGSVGWFHSRAVPILDEVSGEITQWFGIATEITDRKVTEEALRRSAEILKVATDVGGVGVWDWNASGEVFWSEAINKLLGYAPGQAPANYARWQDTVHPEDLPHVEQVLTDARKSRRDYKCDYRVVHPGGEVRWISASGRFFYDDEGHPVRMLGAMLDTTQRRMQEEWQKLLVAELQHRVRNLISKVGGMLRQSALTHNRVEDYVKHVSQRLQSMGRTQAILTRSPGAKVPLATLVRDELSACAAKDEIFSIEGPDVLLAPRTAEVLSLAIHELATNSVKYGALGGSGRARICWSINEDDAGAQLILHWEEIGTGASPNPARRGFGRHLIEERIPYELHGSGSFVLSEQGLVVEIVTPLVEGSSVLETGTGVPGTRKASVAGR